MSYTLALLREDLRTHLGMDINDLPDAAADRLLNRSYWNLQSKLRFPMQESELTFPTVADYDTYDLVLDEEGIQRITIFDPALERELFLVKVDDWNMFPLYDATLTGQPTHYSRRADSIILWPMPDDDYTMRVKYRMTLADISTNGPEVPQEWHEVILMGAIYRGFFSRGDTNRGQKFRTEWSLLVNNLDTTEEKEKEDNHYSGMRVIKRRYP